MNTTSFSPLNDNHGYGFGGIGVKDIVIPTTPDDSKKTMHAVEALRNAGMTNGPQGNKVAANTVQIAGDVVRGILPLLITGKDGNEALVHLPTHTPDGHYDSLPEVIKNTPGVQAYEGGNVINNTVLNLSALENAKLLQMQRSLITAPERVSIQMEFHEKGEREMLLIANARQSIERSLPPDLHILQGYNQMITDQSLLETWRLRNNAPRLDNKNLPVEVINPSSKYQAIAYDDMIETTAAGAKTPLLAINETELEKILSLPPRSIRPPYKRGQQDEMAMERFESAMYHYLEPIKIRRDDEQRAQPILSVSMGSDGGYLVHQKQDGNIDITHTTIIQAEGELLSTVNNSKYVYKKMENTTGAGDASFSALVVSYLSNMEQFLREFSKMKLPANVALRERACIIATSLLQRTFSQVIYHSMSRNIGVIPPDSLQALMKSIASKSLEAAIAARYEGGVNRSKIRGWNVDVTSWNLGTFL